MNKKEESKLVMLEAAVSVLEEGNGVISQVQMLNEKSKLLRETVNQIRKKSEEFKISSVGKTSAKNLKKDAVWKLALIASSGLYAYGKDNNDSQAMEIGDMVKSTFGKMREEGLITKVRNIVEKTVELGSLLENYGVTQQIIEELSSGVDEYYSRLSQRELGLATKSAARKILSDLFRKADSQTKSLDRMMLRYEESDPALYGKYVSARVIRDKPVIKRIEKS